jgi:hypothetical protein
MVLVINLKTAVVSSASTGCREPSVPARVPGP